MSPQFPALHGVLPMLVTPFNAAGSLDEQSLGRLVEHVVACGADGVAALGLAAEADALSENERRRVTECIVEHLAKRLPLLVTVSAESTTLAVNLALHAEQHGATAVMVAPPRTISAEPSGLERHYSAVSHAITVPLMIQDAPGYIGSGLGTMLIERLVRQHPNIHYVKTEALPAATSVSELRDRLGERIGIFSGTGGLYLLDTLDAGSVGTIPGSDIPDFLVAVTRAHRAGREHEARAAFRHVLPLLVYQMQSLQLCIACTKAVLVQRGVIEHEALRSPGLQLHDHTKAQLLRLYAEAHSYFVSSTD